MSSRRIGAIKRQILIVAMLLIATVSISNGQINSNNTTEINCSGQEDCYNQGMELLSKGNCTEAYVALEGAIKDSPSNADAWVGKGRAAACLGNFSEAIKCCDAALVWDSENAQAYVVKAQALVALNKSDEARAIIENAAEKNISNPLLWIELGRVFSNMDMWPDAQECFLKAVDIDPTNEEGWYLEAQALQKLERFEEAIIAYNQSVEMNSSNEDAWMGRAQTLEALKLYSEAETSYSNVLDLDPQNEFALLHKGQMLLLLKRNDEASRVFGNLTDLTPDEATAWNGMGLALGKLGKCNESIAAYDRAISLDGNNTEAWMGRGDAQLCLGMPNLAQDTYMRVLRMDNLSGPAQERMAYTLYLMGRTTAALTYSNRSLREDMRPPSNYARAWFTFANALNASHHHDRAIEQYLIAAERVSFTSPFDPEIDLQEIEWAREMAYIHRAEHEYGDNPALFRSDYTHARDYFQNLTETNELDTNTWMVLGICNFKLWQFDRAAECFNRVLENDPTNFTAAEWSAKAESERKPHIDLVDFSNEDIDFSSIPIGWEIIDWRPPENFRVVLENLADIDGTAVVKIWTVPGEHIKQVELTTVEIPVQKNSQNTFNGMVRIPFDTFTGMPDDIWEFIGILREIGNVELTCEVTVKES